RRRYPDGRRLRDGADRDHGGVSLARQAVRSLRCPLTPPPLEPGPTPRPPPPGAGAPARAAPKAGFGLPAGGWFAVLFLNLPILFIVLYGFTTDEQSYSFPPPGLTTKGFGVTLGGADVWRA